MVETVRVPRAAIRTIKRSLTTVLRGRIVPLKSVNSLLGLDAVPKANADDELAVLVVRLGDESVGLLVDDFRETLDIILKPMTGVLAGLSAYAGSALMGDGSVLMVLNVKEIVVMAIEYKKNLAVFHAVVSVEEAETCWNGCRKSATAKVDLTACVHLHPANLQVLMAAKPAIQAWPTDAGLRAWVEQALAER